MEGQTRRLAERFIEHLTWPEADAAIARGVDAVLIPIGATGQLREPQQP